MKHTGDRVVASQTKRAGAERRCWVLLQAAEIAKSGSAGSAAGKYY